MWRLAKIALSRDFFSEALYFWPRVRFLRGVEISMPSMRSDRSNLEWQSPDRAHGGGTLSRTHAFNLAGLIAKTPVEEFGKRRMSKASLIDEHQLWPRSLPRRISALNAA